LRSALGEFYAVTPGVKAELIIFKMSKS